MATTILPKDTYYTGKEIVSSTFTGFVMAKGHPFKEEVDRQLERMLEAGKFDWSRSL